MNFLDWPVQQFEVLMVVLIRVAAILAALPVLGNRRVPLMARAGLALAFALMLFPGVETEGFRLPEGNVAFLVALLGEVAIGLFIGFLAQLVFAAVQLAGQFSGYQMGFGIVSVLDPQTSSQLSIIALFENFVALLLFLSMDGHHILLRAMSDSFRLIPLFQGQYPLGLAQILMEHTGRVFVMAIKIGAPIMAVLLFTNLSMGVIARTVPQMNVFIVAFPLQIGVGLIVLGMSLPLTVSLLRRSFITMGHDVGLVLRLIGGG